MLKSIPISQIYFQERKSDSKIIKSEVYKALVESISRLGFVGAFSVSIRDDSMYQLIDSRKRFLAAREVGLKTVTIEVN